MKRVRDDSNNNIEEEERCPTNRNFRIISQENTCSNTNNIINPGNNIINNVVNTKLSSSTSSSSAINNNNNNENKEQDRFLPIANVGRIMKNVIPGNGKISKDAKETVQECVSEFISFVTGEASEKCQREKRKTINGDDILWAIMTLGFEDYVNPLKLYLTKYREIEGEKLNNVPKQQRLEQQQQQQQHSNPNPNPNPNFNNSLYGITQPQYPFSQNSQQDNFHRHW